MNTMTFNHVPIPDFMIVTGVSFDAIGDISIQEMSIPGRLGNIDNGITRGGKNIQLTCKLIKKGEHIQEYADRLKLWLKGDNWNPSRLTLSEQPDYYFMARVINSVDIDDLYAVGETTIDFYASDPVKYKKDFTALSSDNGLLQFTYRGIEDSPLLLTFTTPVDLSSVSFTQERSGRVTSITGNIKKGSVIEIDSNKKVVKLNGSINMNLLSLSNEWLYAVSGINTIVATTEIKKYEAKYQERM